MMLGSLWPSAWTLPCWLDRSPSAFAFSKAFAWPVEKRRDVERKASWPARPIASEDASSPQRDHSTCSPTRSAFRDWTLGESVVVRVRRASTPSKLQQENGT
eukprot:12484222-Prorocentrum_lima.AAC.1